MVATQGTLVGLYVPTTNVWDDISRIQEIDIESPEFRELLVRLYQNINNIALSLNIKDSAYYDRNEFVNGQLFFPDPALSSSSSTVPQFRPVFRLVIDFGALPDAGVSATKSVPHGLSVTPGFTFTRIYGAASDTTGLSYIPLPYASPTLINNIQLDVDATNVTITTGAGTNRSNYNKCYIVLEYMKY